MGDTMFNIRLATLIADLSNAQREFCEAVSADRLSHEKSMHLEEGNEYGESLKREVEKVILAAKNQLKQLQSSL